MRVLAFQIRLGRSDKLTSDSVLFGVFANAQCINQPIGFPIRSVGADPQLDSVNETDWKAFSAVCTHLNCTVQYQEARREIWCACHNGTYDLEGRVASGPPPKPLEELAVRVRGDSVVISKRV